MSTTEINGLPELLRKHSLADEHVQEAPWDYYQAMHEQGFYYDEHLGMFVCANYQLMRQIMRNTKLFSNVNSQNVSTMREPPAEVRNIMARSQREFEILVAADPPKHTRVRKMLDDPFRPRSIQAWREAIIEIVNHAIDQFIETNRFEAVADFAIPVPVTVIADILGIDRKHAATIKEWSDASVEPLGMLISDQRWIECAKIIEQFQAFIIKELEARQTNPRDDLLTHMVRVEDEDGTRLTLGETLGSVQQLLVAGNETTTNGIAAGIQLLCQNPEQQKLLRENPERMYTFVNEALRLESPVQGLFRITTADTEIEGHSVPKGSRIMLRYAAANRDPDKFEHPDQVDVFRPNAGTQVGFGAGIHHCIGANLAREEMFQAFTALLARTSELRLVSEAEELRHHPSLILRGLTALEVEFDC